MKELSPQEHDALARARLLVLDVDGVLTDGRVVYAGEQELQSFHVHDGQGLAWVRAAGIEIAWISGRGSRPTEIRASELGVRELHTRVKDKAQVLTEVQRQLDLGPEVTVAMGDDLPDLGLARRAAFFAAPADARPEVRARADYVTEASGGAGAVRELCELLLTARGAWEEHVAGAGHDRE